MNVSGFVREGKTKLLNFIFIDMLCTMYVLYIVYNYGLHSALVYFVMCIFFFI